MPARLDGHETTRRPTAATLTGAILAIAVLAGCGGPRAHRAPAPSTASSPRGPVLVTFKRTIGVDPLSSYFTLYSNGTGVATVVYGGTNGGRVHHFDLSKTQLSRVKRLLQHTRLQNEAVRNPNLYIYWVIAPNGAHRLQQGTIPRSARPQLDALNAIAAANHLF